jgi:A-macroglobulin complement component/alpha-2-macroglobulin family protein/MG2 domain-containing protein
VNVRSSCRARLLGAAARAAADALGRATGPTERVLVIVRDDQVTDEMVPEIRSAVAGGGVAFVDAWRGDATQLLRFAPSGTFRELRADDPPLSGPTVLASVPRAHSSAERAGDPRIAGVEVDGVLRVIATAQDTLCHGCSCAALPGRMAFGANLVAHATAVASKRTDHEGVEVVAAKLEGTLLRVEASFCASAGNVAHATLELLPLDGAAVALQAADLRAGEMRSLRFEVQLPSPFEVLDHRVVATLRDDVRTLRDVRPLEDLVGTTDLRVLGTDALCAGGRGTVRVLCRNTLRDVPVAGAALTLELLGMEGSALARAEGVSDGDGTAPLVLDVARDASASARLVVTARTQLATDRLERTVRVGSRLGAHLFCDLPIHRPGDALGVRALVVDQPSAVPVAARLVKFEIRGPGGDAQARASATTDGFGVAAAQIPIPGGTQPGDFRAVLLADGTEIASIPLRVERFEVPTFRVSVEPLGRGAEPGTDLTALVRATRFDGTTVGAADVTAALRAQNADPVPLARSQTRTDDRGEARVVVQVPARAEHGSPALDGEPLLLDVTVRDPGGREVRETARFERRSQGGSAGAMRMIVPDGPLVAGHGARALLVTGLAEGQLLGVCVGDEPSRSRAADEFGIVEVPIAAADRTTVVRVGADTFTHTASSSALALRVDHRVVEPSGSIRGEVLTDASRRTAFADLLRDGAIVATATVPLAAGRGTVEFRVPEGVVGPLALHAYTSVSGGSVVGDARAVLVVPPELLRVAVVPSRSTVRPGERLDLDVTVTGASGGPAPAILAARVADTAVLSLVASDPDCVRAVLVLDGAVRRAPARVGGHSAAGIASLAARRALTAAEQRVSDALFSSLDSAVRYDCDETTVPSRRARYCQRVHETFSSRRPAFVASFTAALTGGLSPDPGTTRGLVAALRGAEAAGAFGRPGILDPWGSPLDLELGDEDVDLKSVGPDGLAGTDDDCTIDLGREAALRLHELWCAGHGKQISSVPSPWVSRHAGGGGAGGGAAGCGGRRKSAELRPPRDRARMRRFFPHALLWAPSVATDADGHARIPLTAPDSLTTWRVDVIASDREGRAADATASFRTAQSFSAELDPPPAVYVGDEVEIPVLLRWTDAPRLRSTGHVSVSTEGRLLSAALLTIYPPPSGDAAAFVRVRAVAPGSMKIALRAESGDLADAVERVVQVQPCGRLESHSATLCLEGGGDAARVRLDSDGLAIPGTSRAEVRLLPSPIAAVLDGVEGLLRKPHGCFEQTSSCLYPDVLALLYLHRSRAGATETFRKFDDAIDEGVERLLSFEIPGGGFDWFGRAPGKPLLTAYGLHEWTDIAALRPAAQAIASRTANWLASLQRADGSFPTTDAPYQWRHDSAGSAAATAYVAWALAREGSHADSVRRALDFLAPQLAGSADRYTLGLAAAAHLELDRRDAKGIAVAARLASLLRTDGDRLVCTTDAATALHGRRDAAKVEATAVAALVAIRLGRPEILPARPLLASLGRARLADGTWGTTQATVLALRALLEAGAGPEEGTTVVTLRSRGAERRTVIPNSDLDVPTTVDVTEFLVPGGPLDLVAECRGNTLTATIVVRACVPFDAPRPLRSPLRLTVRPDRTQVAAGGLVTLAIRLDAKSRDPVALPLLEIPLPAGFVADLESVDAMRRVPGVERVEADSRCVAVYLRELTAALPFEATLGVRPRLRGRMTAPPPSAGPYYEPDAQVHATATVFTVK